MQGGRGQAQATHEVAAGLRFAKVATEGFEDVCLPSVAPCNSSSKCTRVALRCVASSVSSQASPAANEALGEAGRASWASPVQRGETRRTPDVLHSLDLDFLTLSDHVILVATGTGSHSQTVAKI